MRKRKRALPRFPYRAIWIELPGFSLHLPKWDFQKLKSKGRKHILYGQGQDLPSGLWSQMEEGSVVSRFHELCNILIVPTSCCLLCAFAPVWGLHWKGIPGQKNGNGAYRRTTLWEVFAINLELWGAPREPSTRLSLELYNITTSLWEQDVFLIALFGHRLALEVVPLILYVKSTHYSWLASEMCFPIWKYWFFSFPFGPPL